MKSIEATKSWCDAHGYLLKKMGNKYYFQTNYQTCELDENGRIIAWHSRSYYNEIDKRKED